MRWVVGHKRNQSDSPKIVRGRGSLCALFLITTMLGGCNSATTQGALAPSPPSVHAMAFAPQKIDTINDIDPAQLANIMPASGTAAQEHISAPAPALNARNSKEEGCRLKDRFDRNAALAYEWGRNRLAFDVDGVDFNGGDKAARIEYKIRLQPEKTKKQRCRYGSNWQGLIGSGYNELVLREGDDTVWDEIQDSKEDVVSYIDRMF